MLGLTAVLAPITVQSGVIKREMPVLILMRCSVRCCWDYNITELEAWLLLAIFAVYMGWSVYLGAKGKQDWLQTLLRSWIRIRWR